jgi:hypothetical protein
MADLMTRISADDAQFQAGMQRIDQRMTSIGQTAGRVSKIMKGLGVVGVANFAVGLITQLDEVREKAVSASDEIKALGRSAVENLNRRRDQFNGVDSNSPQGIRADAGKSINEVMKKRDDALIELEKKSLLGRAALEIYNEIIGADEVTIEAMQEKIRQDAKLQIAAINGAANQTVAAYAAKRDRERAAGIAASQDEVEQKFIADEARKGEARLSLSNQLESRRIQMLRETGRGREAELAEQAERSQKLRREIEGADYLSGSDRSRALQALNTLDASARESIDERFMNSARASARDGFQSVGVGGATFGQQMSLATQGVERSIKNIDTNLEKAARDLNTVATRLNAPGYSLASYQD